MTTPYHLIGLAVDIFVLSVVPVLFSDAREMPLKVKPIHIGEVTCHA